MNSEKSVSTSKSWSVRDKVLISSGVVLLTAINVGIWFFDRGQLFQEEGAPPVHKVEIANLEVKPLELTPTTTSAETKTTSTLSALEGPRISMILPPAANEPIDTVTQVPLLPSGPSTLSGSQFETREFDKNSILDDTENRINDAFAVTPSIRDRVAFWFDVYTKHDENKRIIHYARHPWIVFKIVDVSDIINAKTPKRRWMRNEKADKYAASESKKIKLALASVSRKRSLTKLTPYEKLVVDALKPLGGKVQNHARLALTETRTQMGQKNFYETGLRISGRYLPQMEEIFASKNLPTELTRLPLVESSFNKMATSKDGAAGIWQFMGNTGRKFMVINDSIDERRSPFKATDAAAYLLKENHLILYRQWPLALTAYNHGPGGVRAAVKATGTKDLGLIARKYRSKMFGFASSNFYACFLAALHAQKYQDKIWSSIDVEAGLQTHFVRLPRAYRVAQLIKLTGMTKETLLMLNPDLSKVVNSNGMVPSGLRFYIPDSLRTKTKALFAQSETDRRIARRKG